MTVRRYGPDTDFGYVLFDLEFLRVIDIRIDNFTKHPHLYKQPPSRSVKSLKKKMEKLHRKYVFAPADKAANNVIII